MIRHNHRGFYKFMWLIPSLFYLCSCNAADNQQELIPVTIGITSFIGEAASFVAVEKGFFRENGLDVTLQVNNAGSESIRQLYAGDVDIAHIAETPILYSRLQSGYYTGERKGELQIVANMILANSIQKAVARRDVGIETPGDIRGKRVALARGTQLEYLLDSFLLEHQISISEIDTLNMHIVDKVEAIKKGKIDVAFLWEPFATQVLFQLGDNAVVLPTNLTYSTLWLINVLDSYSSKNPEVIKAYLKSLLQAQQYIRENPAWAIALLAEKTSTEFDVMYNVFDQIDYELNLSERMLHLLKEQQRWMLKIGIVDQDGFDIFEMINVEYMEEVYPQGISLIR
jgi:ABC-type nitrate/sulfonate/bicarbonate transport system substrate-binding protein